MSCVAPPRLPCLAMFGLPVAAPPPVVAISAGLPASPILALSSCASLFVSLKFSEFLIYIKRSFLEFSNLVSAAFIDSSAAVFSASLSALFRFSCAATNSI